MDDAAVDGIVSQPAPHVEILPPSAWSPSWTNRPIEPVSIGIRLVSSERYDLAIVRAREMAISSLVGIERPLCEADANLFVEKFNTNLIFEVLVEALCEAEDVTQAYFKHAPNHVIRLALPAKTGLFLWEKYEILKQKLNPLAPEATADVVERLILNSVAALHMPDSKARRRALRLVSMVHDELVRLVG